LDVVILKWVWPFTGDLLKPSSITKIRHFCGIFTKETGSLFNQNHACEISLSCYGFP
jgi:hypothetical protein